MLDVGQAGNFAKALKIMIESISPNILLLFFILALLIGGIFTAILIYHWKNFGTESKLIVKGKKTYYIGLGFFVLMMLVSFLIFLNN